VLDVSRSGLRHRWREQTVLKATHPPGASLHRDVIRGTRYPINAAAVLRPETVDGPTRRGYDPQAAGAWPAIHRAASRKPAAR
jgi:hypothetical protein